MTDEKLRRMQETLHGLSVGDAFGEQFFRRDVARRSIAKRRPPPGPWRWTDDTNLACSLAAVIAGHGTVDRDELAASFGAHFDPRRGYGRAMLTLLPAYAAGADWRLEASRLFGGEGSFGNGAAMRVAPLGAFFSDDLDRVVAEATKSAEVTHAHREGIAGAVAVAVAAAVASADPSGSSPGDFVARVAAHTPGGEVRNRLDHAGHIGGDTGLGEVVSALGNGSRISAQDTVAFCVWVASRHLDDYPGALWLTAGAGGDVDTTCAIVGGIVAAHTGVGGIPAAWLRRREPLPDWAPG